MLAPAADPVERQGTAEHDAEEGEVMNADPNERIDVVAASQPREPMKCDMTLRDVFACAALTGLLHFADQLHPPHALSGAAYDMADAMLRAREAKP